MGCFEVELIKNNLPCDTKYRLEFIGNQYIGMTIQELRVLKRKPHCTCQSTMWLSEPSTHHDCRISQ